MAKSPKARALKNVRTSKGSTYLKSDTCLTAYCGTGKKTGFRENISLLKRKHCPLIESGGLLLKFDKSQPA